ncbi:MAG: hypothetical protein AAB830_02135 [Patescibacteria group bacterium]
MRKREIEIIPTYVPHDAADLAEGIRAIRTFSSQIHVDITDGLFTPEFTWPYVKKGEFGKFNFAGADGLFAEVHLMTENPRAIGIAFARAGASRILGHIEAFSTAAEAKETLLAWRANGADETGLSALLNTPFEMIEPLIPMCDAVHLMSIASIGAQGIPFDPRGITRIRKFHSKYPDVLISVDGGVAESNIADLVRAGARRFGVGSAISRSENPAASYTLLKTLAESAML